MSKFKAQNKSKAQILNTKTKVLSFGICHYYKTFNNLFGLKTV